MNAIGGALLIASGAYLVASWLPAVLGDGDAQPIGAIERASSTVTNVLAGHTGAFAIGLAAVAVAAAGVAAAHRRSPTLDLDAMMTIGQVAARAGVRASHIRYYERVGVLPQPQRVSGQRRYDEGVLHRLAIIDVAQRAGFTLQEIRDLMASGDGEAAGERVRALAEAKLPDVDALIQRAEAVMRWLQVARTCDCATVDVCALFVDPTLAPPPGGGELTIRRVASRSPA